MNKVVLFLRDYAEDFLVFFGLLLINVATYRINVTAGLYCTGGTMLLAGILFLIMARKPPKGEVNI
ncbi:hypothetical protein D3C74_414030 [compost metagenome]